MNKIKQRLSNFGRRLSTVPAEILLITGAFFIVTATATISMTAATYVVGAMLCATGLFIAKNK